MPRKNLLTVSEEEEQRIQAGIASDPDNPEMTDEQLASARPLREVLPELAAGIDRELAKRGRPRSDDPRKVVTLRLPQSVLSRWQKHPDWRARMAEALEKSVE